MQKYLIIGGAGFIGSHLSRALLEKGNKVVVLDKRNGLDINIPESAEVVFSKEKPDIVFHLAGPINLRKSATDPLFISDSDFLSRTEIILNVCKKYHVKKLIFVSSGGSIYQDAAQVPTGEEYPAHPTAAYGLANLAIENCIKNSGVDFVIARLANAYGPGQWESGFIPTMIINILKKVSPIINGTGRQTRDFVYIEDAVEALIILAQKGGNEIYNVGSGKEISLNDLFLLIKNILGAQVEPVYKTLTVPETRRSAVDITKIQTEIGWFLKTDIKEGLVKTIEYYAKS